MGVVSWCGQCVMDLFDCLTMKCCFYDGGVAPALRTRYCSYFGGLAVATHAQILQLLVCSIIYTLCNNNDIIILLQHHLHDPWIVQVAGN